jgi:hypothetical protein
MSAARGRQEIAAAEAEQACVLFEWATAPGWSVARVAEHTGLVELTSRPRFGERVAQPVTVRFVPGPAGRRMGRWRAVTGDAGASNVASRRALATSRAPTLATRPTLRP